MISVLLADDEALIRAGLRMILETSDDLTVVDEAGDGQAAVAAVERHRPDVVLMDIRMPRLDGLEATAAIRAKPQPPSVIVLTTFNTDHDVFRALEAGATGFLLKDTPPADLLRAVRLAAAGDAMLSPSVTRQVIHRFTAEDRSRSRVAALDRLRPLTEREREVLVQIGLGHANAVIARALHMSEATVKSHITRLFEKLAATNRVQLAIAAFRAGLVE
ncbi:DNA-binding NarL/FixJ family response regulator [Actinoplanes campanulatus]|uniref:DNA-binding NarL/FixJ family response regulator n=1 Tax=Actinoplanes campanulatus TaxID=113559 RepID=A0A7W5FJK5_9ACTN|nr:response regulator transcription factor [Actinoplanes campanulatus]MBB3100736.1 DNA-binding NarL/FixJ family response regulator [Actinoplanes campanulatus]GGN46075.1 DNA-binding response regulator [Actinoplanes campanulatus]GID41202.1 DNA-binding response regulator [Actinoplanes campanulatus]